MEMNAPHVITSREFGHNVSSAKHLAKEGPLFITDHGEPAFVLLNIGDYRALSRGDGDSTVSLLELMDSMPDTSEVEDFEITPTAIQLRPEV
ncbi:hypothetical protein APR50_07285 [Variovorax paradoxus]|jgi:PHD/YefM family antitoxin component YafN of YafNO toxin-antitoxin module|nr:hypothetical protein APR52_43315 [Variovorax paradoxus]KPU90515.1 hypothetical protein APR49_41545 [Variovorax paradoxus]KPV10222.1 hypothetical protein APR50_07285 [Variovorax paradoxus]KPV10673.1 hypothetical protein APR51_42105 [Variovorax paradoxus]KPV19650.1 hypothetical protein APR48_39645 [Variovorax paradoxus]